jgi:hypothetical protein
MHNIEIYKTKRGCEKFNYEGYTYTLRKDYGEYKIWRCENRKCYGALKIEKNAPMATRQHFY